MTLRRLLLPLLALALFAGACEPTTATAISAQGLQRQADGWHGVPLEVERTMPDVTLLDTAGNQVDLREATAGTPTLLFFGYTSCPDICPIHLAVIAGAMRELGVTTEQVQMVFVSVDPERDTPDRIDAYLANFNHRFLGVHGDREVVEDALRQLDLPGPVIEGADPRGEGDLIGHPAQVIGFDADGEARRVWPFGARRSDWIRDLPRILEEWSSESAA
ncbi:SCO family protein [Egicoccus sp. AB-alg6-2]|uniref:SCO family protein n=1 Tax=Egicoccus sp. AB-alg6-2 TaxID=3242692 RepID=UPI00359EBF33